MAALGLYIRELCRIWYSCPRLSLISLGFNSAQGSTKVVAIKDITVFENPDRLEAQFKIEIEVMSICLTSPYVVDIYGYESTPSKGILSIVMEFVALGSLCELPALLQILFRLSLHKGTTTCTREIAYGLLL